MSSLHEIALEFTHELRRDGALRSALRRAKQTSDIWGHETVERFTDRLLKTNEHQSDEACIAALILLAQRNVARPRDELEPTSKDTLATSLGEKRGNHRLLSALRFQRLLRAESIEERLAHVRRALALLASPMHPTHIITGWFDLLKDSKRRKFARAYFNGPQDSAEADVA